jgi:phenylacetate-coenzyme A ligase PaaK-like adenylate-forming protein
MNINDLLKIGPYSFKKTEKEKLFNTYLNELTIHHYTHCEPYRKIITSINFDEKKKYFISDIPFLPVQLFKTNKLISTSTLNTVKILSSSGTSGQKKTQVYLDKETSANQSKVLAKITSSFFGNTRSPMIIIDSQKIISNRNQISARAAGVIGFSLLGVKPTYILNEDLGLNIDLLKDLLIKHQEERIVIFGFTFMVYQYFYKALVKLNLKPNLSNAVLIHGGGWKKLEKESVLQEEFKNKLFEIAGIRNIFDYYGMAEQTGSIFMQCEFGNYHASIFSDIIIRRALDFSIADVGEEGIIQVLSLLPKSYPGHSLLTEDKGILLGEDSCSCNRLGKYFKITGRIENVELRGCSDSYE